jgi:DNA polymerase III alpha subunit (gram-positive type)
MNFEIYVTDVETTGLDSRNHDVIELSILRLSTGEQKTWTIKPTNLDTIDPGALRINGHKMEDLRWETKFGRDTYREAGQALVEVENWLGEDGLPSEKRVLCGQNVSFDRDFLQQLWIKANSKDSFPFGRRYVDTMQIEFVMDWIQGTMAEGYSLSNLVKKYGVKNERAHSAAADVKATTEVFQRQVADLRAKFEIAKLNEDTVRSTK